MSFAVQVRPIWETIAAYCRSECYAELLDLCDAKHIKFVDPEFRPSSSSLFRSSADRSDYSHWRDLEWARCCDVLGQGEFNLFNEISPEKLRQGDIQNCYFLCALAVLAERPSLIKRLFEVDEPIPEGAYAVWLNTNGIWRQTIVDDFLPVAIQGNACEFAFSRTEEDDIWVMLLEKAYAKTYGSYEAVSCGNVVFTLRDLTGAPYVLHENIWSEAESLWEELSFAFEKSYLVVCFQEGSAGHKSSTVTADGQAHSVIDCVEVNDSFGRPARLLLVRNVWSDWSWMGDWSDKSNLWTPELKQRLASWDKKEGLCWLSLQDFVQLYQTVAIIKVEPNNFYTSVPIKQALSADKQMIRFDVDAAGEYTFSIDQPDIRFHAGQQHPYAY